MKMENDIGIAFIVPPPPTIPPHFYNIHIHYTHTYTYIYIHIHTHIYTHK